MNVAACPTYADQGLGVAHALASVDCHVGTLVGSSYARLFGAGGAFGAVLTALLTLYVAFVAIGLMTGRTRLTLSGMTPRLVSIAMVLTFATSWPAYHAVVYGLLVSGPEQIASAIAGDSGNALGFAARLDILLGRFADLARTMGDTAPGASKALGPLAGPQMAAALIWLSGMMILLASAGTLVLTRIVLALLLAIGPVFIVLGLFRQTRGLLEGWLRTSLLFGIAPTLTVLVGSAALSLLGPLIDAIADDPAGAVSDLRPVLELFMGSVVYVALVAMLGWTAASLVRGWHFGFGDAEPAAMAGESPSSQTLALAGAASAGVGGAANPPADARVGSMVVALSREAASDAAPVSVRVEQAAAARQEAFITPASGGGSPQRRTEGLGQGLRPAARSTRIAGAVS
jgi:type IV secretion system protein VirB6